MLSRPLPEVTRVQRARACVAVVVAVAVARALPAAAAELSKNIVFHSRLDEHVQYSDIWGYTDPGGDEYALLTATDGLAVINVTDPKNPYETGFIPMPVSTWQDVQTYQHWAYLTNESSGGMAIVSLADPENPVYVGSWTGNGFTDAHTLYIDTATARAYIAGSGGTGGVRIVSLANPTSPVQVGQWNTTYLHEVYVQDNVLYGAAIQTDTFYLLDVSNPANVTIMGSIANYPGAFTHSTWATPDGNYCMTTDELVGSRCIMWNVSNPANIVQADDYFPNPNTIPHNLHIEGNLAFISHYTIGVRVVDISNPFDIVEVGFYDTHPEDDSGQFRGCWGVYPAFQNQTGLVVASDFKRGLFVLEYKGALGKLAGTIRDAGSGDDVTHATVEILETGNGAAAAASGSGYMIEDSPGAVNLRTEAFGYATSTTAATITAGTTTVHDVVLTPVPGGTVSGTVADLSSALPIAGAKVEVLGTPLAETADVAGHYATTNLPAGDWTIRAWAFGYDASEAHVHVEPGATIGVSFALGEAFRVDEFEVASGWTVSGTATSGQWERADPESTSDYLGPVQSGSDHTPSPGTLCWVTGQLAGGGPGSFDVDGGPTILTSPVFDLSGVPHPRVRYWRWYVSGILFQPTSDFWVVEASSNSGATWTTVETTDLGDPAWLPVDLAIDSFIVPTSQVRFRFTAQDTGAGSCTEAAIDDFTIYGVGTHAATGAPELLAPFEIGPMTPNPLAGGRPGTIRLVLPRSGAVTAAVYDVAGRRVASLVDAVLPAGAHAIRWDGASREGAPAGVYFVRLETPEGNRSSKVLVLR
jgi:choice-of-anchor B domain-containing protein